MDTGTVESAREYAYEWWQVHRMIPVELDIGQLEEILDASSEMDESFREAINAEITERKQKR